MPSEEIVDIIVVDGFSAEFALREGRAISSVAIAFILHNATSAYRKDELRKKEYAPICMAYKCC